MRCQSVTAEGVQKRICEVVQIVRMQGRPWFTNASNRDLALPLSFRGLAPALDALNRTP